MEFVSNFAERLDELRFDRGLTGEQLAHALGVRKNLIYYYLNDKRQPSIKMLVKMADYFQCSTDFLLGLEEENTAKTFKICPPFSEQLQFLLKHFQTNKYRLCKEVPITHSVIYAWQNGTSVPLLDHVLKLAKHFDCSVDFILGRES